MNSQVPWSSGLAFLMLGGLGGWLLRLSSDDS
jgi:hypothetical protein